MKTLKCIEVITVCMFLGSSVGYVTDAFCNPLPKASARYVDQVGKVIGNQLAAKAIKPRKILVFYRCEGFRHSVSIDAGNASFEVASKKTGAFTVDFSDDYQAFRAENLKQYDAVVLNNTTHLKVNAPANRFALPALIDFVKSGKGLAVIHSGADNFADAPDGAYLVGGLFWGHPWHAGGTWAFRVEDPKNPVNASFEKQYFKFGDEIYMQQSPYYDRSKLHVLVSLDLADPATKNTKGQRRADNDYAVSWIRPYGKGRVFYTSFGHDQRAWLNKTISAHIFAGLQYALGDLKADDTPGVPAYQPPDLTNSAFESLKTQKFQAGAYSIFVELLHGIKDPAKRENIKERLASILLDSSYPKASKIAVLRLFAVVGLPKDLKGIQSMLALEETQNMAIALLVPRLSPKEMQSLLGKGCTENAQCTLINAWAKQGACGAIRLSLQDKRPAVVKATCLALGRIGTEDALKALLAFTPSKETKDSYTIGLANALNQMAERGETRQALPVAKKLFADFSQPQELRAAAARVMVCADGGAFTDVMKDKNAFVRQSIIRSAQNVDIKKAVQDFDIATTADQIALLGLIAERGDRSVATTCVKALSSKEESVVCAALDALRVIGDATVLPQIIESLKRGGSIEQSALFSLGNMKDKSVGTELFKLAQKEKRLIPVLQDRAELKFFGSWNILVSSSDSKIRREAWKAISRIATVKEVPLLFDWIGLVQQPEVYQAKSTIVAVLRNVGKTEREQMILKSWQKTNAPVARTLLIGLMNSYPSEQFLTPLVSVMKSEKGNLQEVAIDALANWKSLAPYDAVKEAYLAETDPTLRKNMSRALTKIVSTNAGNQKRKLYQDIYRICSGERDRLVLMFYQNINYQTFDVLQGLFSDSDCGMFAKRSYVKLFDEKLKDKVPDVFIVNPQKWHLNASHNKGELSKAIDQNENTRWTTGGASVKGMWLTIDLGENILVSKICLDTTNSPQDTPNGCEVFISDNGKQWVGPVCRSDGKEQKKTTFQLNQKARHIKFVTMDKRDYFYWSIHEIKIWSGMNQQLLDLITKTVHLVR